MEHQSGLIANKAMVMMPPWGARASDQDNEYKRKNYPHESRPVESGRRTRQRIEGLSDDGP